MTPSELKELAEWLGKETFLVMDGRKADHCVIYIDPPKPHTMRYERRSIRYDPETNPDQMLEVIKKFKTFQISNMGDHFLVRYSLSLDSGFGMSEGETFEQAILNAALQAARREE